MQYRGILKSGLYYPRLAVRLILAGWCMPTKAPPGVALWWCKRWPTIFVYTVLVAGFIATVSPRLALTFLVSALTFILLTGIRCAAKPVSEDSHDGGKPG
jgi:hypothetical protein